MTPPRDLTQKPSTPKKWTAAEKLRVVTEARGLKDAELGELLRREGLHEDRLRSWIAAASEALESEEAVPTLADRRRLKALTARVRELEREARRKDKALAETVALLVLEKKLQALGWDDEDDGTDERSDE